MSHILLKVFYSTGITDDTFMIIIYDIDHWVLLCEVFNILSLNSYYNQICNAIHHIYLNFLLSFVILHGSH